MFMQPCIYQGNIVEFDTSDGTYFVPEEYSADFAQQYTDEQIYDMTYHRDTYYGHMSAGGYMDRTEHIIGDSPVLVLKSLYDLYANYDDEEEMSDWRDEFEYYGEDIDVLDKI